MIHHAIQRGISAAEPLKLHRHETLAHNDAAPMLSAEDVLPLYPEDIASSLLELTNAYNAMSVVLGEPPRRFGLLLNTSGAEALLETLVHSDAWRLHVRLNEDRAAQVRLSEDGWSGWTITISRTNRAGKCLGWYNSEVG